MTEFLKVYLPLVCTFWSVILVILLHIVSWCLFLVIFLVSDFIITLDYNIISHSLVFPISILWIWERGEEGGRYYLCIYCSVVLLYLGSWGGGLGYDEPWMPCRMLYFNSNFEISFLLKLVTLSWQQLLMTFLGPCWILIEINLSHPSMLFSYSDWLNLGVVVIVICHQRGFYSRFYSKYRCWVIRVYFCLLVFLAYLIDFDISFLFLPSHI